MSDVPKAIRSRLRRRTGAVTAVLVAGAVVAAACGGGSSGGPTSSAPASGSSTVGAGSAEKPLAPATVTLWVGFTARELKIIKGVVADFERAHPGVKVKTVGGISDDKIVASIRGGNAPDIAQSFS